MNSHRYLHKVHTWSFPNPYFYFSVFISFRTLIHRFSPFYRLQIMKIAVFCPKHYYKNRPVYYQNGGNIFWAIHFYWGNYTLWQILKDQTVSLRQKKIIFTNIPFAIFKTTKSSILSHVSSSPNPLLFPLESLQLGQQLICSNLLHSGQQFRLTGATPAFC